MKDIIIVSVETTVTARINWEVIAPVVERFILEALDFEIPANAQLRVENEGGVMVDPCVLRIKYHEKPKVRTTKTINKGGDR